MGECRRLQGDTEFETLLRLTGQGDGHTMPTVSDESADRNEGLAVPLKIGKPEGMRTESPSEDRPRRSTWVQPMLWLVLTPVVTVPATLVLTDLILHTNACQVTPEFFIGGEASCQPGPVLAALLPGLLNLAPILWLRSSESKTRFAAIAATTIGAVRLIVPLAILMTNASVDPPHADYGTCGGVCTHLSWGFQPAFPNSGAVDTNYQLLGPVIVSNYDAVLISLFLWFLSVVALISMRWVLAMSAVEPRSAS